MFRGGGVQLVRGYQNPNKASISKSAFDVNYIFSTHFGPKMIYLSYTNDTSDKVDILGVLQLGLLY